MLSQTAEHHTKAVSALENTIGRVFVSFRDVFMKLEDVKMKRSHCDDDSIQSLRSEITSRDRNIQALEDRNADLSNQVKQLRYSLENKEVPHQNSSRSKSFDEEAYKQIERMILQIHWRLQNEEKMEYYQGFHDVDTVDILENIIHWLDSSLLSRKQDIANPDTTERMSFSPESDVHISIGHLELQCCGIEQTIQLYRDVMESTLIYWSQRLNESNAMAHKHLSLSTLLTDCFICMTSRVNGEVLYKQDVTQEDWRLYDGIFASINVIDTSLQSLDACWQQACTEADRKRKGVSVMSLYENFISTFERQLRDAEGVLVPCTAMIYQHFESFSALDLYLKELHRLCDVIDAKIASSEFILTANSRQTSKDYSKVESIVPASTEIVQKIDNGMARIANKADSLLEKSLDHPDLQDTNERLRQAILNYQISEELLRMQTLALERKTAEGAREIEYLRTIIFELNQRLGHAEELSQKQRLNESYIAYRSQVEMCEGLNAISHEVNGISKELFTQQRDCYKMFQNYHVYIDKYFESLSKEQLLTSTLEEIKSLYCDLSEKCNNLQEQISQRQVVCDKAMQTELESSCDEEYVSKMNDFDASCSRTLAQIEFILNEMKMKSTRESHAASEPINVSYSLLETELISKERIIDGMHQQLQLLHSSCVELANERGVLEGKLKSLHDDNEALLEEINVLTHGQEYFRHDLSLSVERLQQREQELHQMHACQQDVSMLQDMVHDSAARTADALVAARRGVHAFALGLSESIGALGSTLELLTRAMRQSQDQRRTHDERVRSFVYEMLKAIQPAPEVLNECQAHLVALGHLKNSHSQASSLAEAVAHLQSEASAKDKYIDHLEQQVQILHQTVIDQKVDSDVAHQSVETQQRRIEALEAQTLVQHERLLQLQCDNETAVGMLEMIHDALFATDARLSGIEDCMRWLTPSASDCKLRAWPREANDRYESLVAHLNLELEKLSENLELIASHVDCALTDNERERSRSAMLSQRIEELDTSVREKAEMNEMFAREVNELNSKNERIVQENTSLRSQLQENENNYLQNFSNMKKQIYKYEAMHLEDVQKLNHSFDKINILQDKMSFLTKESENKAMNFKNMDLILASKSRSFLDQLQVLERAMTSAEANVKDLLESELQCSGLLESLWQISSDLFELTCFCQERMEGVMLQCVHEPVKLCDSIDQSLVQLQRCLSKALSEAQATSARDKAKCSNLEARLSSNEQDLRDLRLRYEEAKSVMANVQQEVRATEESRVKKDHLIQVLEAELSSLQNELESASREKELLQQGNEMLQDQLVEKNVEMWAAKAALEEEKAVRIKLNEHTIGLKTAEGLLAHLEVSSSTTQRVLDVALGGISRLCEKEEKLVESEQQLSTKTQVVALMELELDSQLARLDQQQELIRHLESQDRLQKVQLEGSWREGMEVYRRLEAAERMLEPLLKLLLEGLVRLSSSCHELRLKVRELEFEYKEEQTLTATLQRQVEGLHDLVLQHQGLSMMNDSSISHKT
eukprot:755470-Hanusia_phi.AAC.1